ncbi:hypothetical protein MAA8898_02140 [Maliponia aquimaris]|uniref:LysR substrate-binding domain-containing protein n=1 Tax=Maliponia aquimaris TaxID=1673631 RepID=A0A238KC85_9RHOB|nr:hypothetical protein MAA8898_02140 [Maliponia aquimaris]
MCCTSSAQVKACGLRSSMSVMKARRARVSSAPAVAFGRSRRWRGILNLRLALGIGGLARCFDPIAELDAEHLLLVSPEAWRRREVKEFVTFFAPRYAAIFRQGALPPSP